MSEHDRRLSQLLGMPVLDLEGEEIGHVNDVRLVGKSGAGDQSAVLRVQGVVVADRFVGSLLGYDRKTEHGPWAVRSVVRWIHRGAKLAPWDAVERVDWTKRTLTVDATRLTPLADTRN
ncbi:MAG TPA: PRC-barrel domain-containing protein [Actinomycetes bacterium]|nr:PRC-barrel domain-containing protein [Actinomycetes bacterium]